MANTLGKYNPFRYRGYVYDEETGLYYLNSRYYDPELCRFISADSLAVPTISPGSASWDKNLYAYCDNNPVKREDDEGDSWEVVLAATVVGGLIGGVSTAINDYIMGRDVTLGSVLSGAAVGAFNGFMGVIFPEKKLLTVGISFATAAANSWLHGASFLEGMYSAFTAASTSFVSGCALGMIPADPSKLVNAIAAGGSVYATSVLTEGTSTAVRGVYEGMTSTDPPDITPPTPQPTTGAVVKNPFIPSMHNTFVVVGGGGRYSNNQMIK